jgi:hypothetical protein
MGGYSVVFVQPAHFEALPQGRKTRITCSILGSKAWHCGILPLGNGDAYIILSKSRLRDLGVGLGQRVSVEIQPDPSPLGAPMPEVLEALLAQDEAFAAQFESLSPGGKRSLIFAMERVKDIDRKIALAYSFMSDRAERKRA